MSAQQHPAKDPIPQFATREEEAEFWDTHYFTDYWDELDPVNLKVSPNLASAILVSLDGAAITQLCEKADSLDVSAETLGSVVNCIFSTFPRKREPIIVTH